jgi:hypothetical protein
MKTLTLLTLLIAPFVAFPQFSAGGIVSNIENKAVFGAVIQNDNMHVDMSANCQTFCANLGYILDVPRDNWQFTVLLGVSTTDAFFNGGFDVTRNFKYFNLSAGIATNQLGRFSVMFNLR